MPGSDVPLLQRPWSSWLKTRGCRHAFWLVWVVAVLGAAGSALPVSAQLHRIVGYLPGGDRVLFEPGGLLLLDLLTQHFDALWAATLAGLMLWFLAWPLAQLARCALFHALGGHARGQTASLPDVLPASLRALPRFIAVWFATRLAQGLLVGLALLAFGAVAAVLDSVLSARGEDLLLLAALGAAFLAASMAQSFADLVRCALTEPGATIGRASGRARRLWPAFFRHRFAHWLLAYASGSLAIVAVALLVTALPEADTVLAVLIALLHQTALLLLMVASTCATALAADWAQRESVPAPEH